jgi:hypothetical protein
LSRVTTSVLSVLWVPGLFVLGVILVVVVIAAAMKTMRRR